MLQYKKRKNGNTDHKKEGNLPPNQNFKRKNGNTHYCLLYTFRAHETKANLVCRLLLEKKKTKKKKKKKKK